MAFTDDMHVKMCKKIAQLTKVIYNLNSRSEESETLMESMKKEYKVSISRIMEENREQISNLKLKYRDHEDYNKELEKSAKAFEELKEYNKQLQNTLNESLDKSKLNEQNLRSDYENKLLDLQNKILERKREYDELIERLVPLQKKLEQVSKGKISDISKQNEEIEKLNRKYTADMKLYEEEKQKFKEHINHLNNENTKNVKTHDDKIHKMKAESEENIQKLKLLHEKELASVRSEMKSSELDQLTAEKQDLNKTFELKKAELVNRIRFLEKALQKLEVENEDLTTGDNELNIKYSNLKQELTEKCLQLSRREEEIKSVFKEKQHLEDEALKQTYKFNELKKKFQGWFFIIQENFVFKLMHFFLQKENSST